MPLSISRYARVAPIAAAFAFAAAPVWAQDLSIGDPAPALTVKEFVKGQPVTKFEKGKTYVVEFWATWCGPCRVSIPHLSELAKQHKDVQFVGVSVWEEDPTLVKPFVEKMGDQMAYSVAADTVPSGGKPTDGAMARAWMTAANQTGIPTAFIVNGDGKVAWIGHPMSMDKPLAAVATGKWDITKAAADFRTATAQKKKMQALNATFNEAFKSGGIGGVVTAMDKAIADDASLESAIGSQKFMLLNRLGDNAKTAEYGKRLVDVVYKDNVGALNDIAWGVVDPAAKQKPTPELVAVALAAAKRADTLAEGKDPAIADTLAKAYFDSGDTKNALKTQERAFALAKGTPAETDKDMLARLEQYKKAANP